MSGVLTLPGASSTRAILDHRPDARAAARADQARIVALIHAGQHRDALAAITRLYGARLHRFFASWQPHEAEDHVQEVLVRVYEALQRGRFNAHAGLSAWLFKVAANLRQDLYRKARRRGDLLARNRAAIERDLHGAGRARHTWDSLSRQEQRLWLQAAIASLTDEEQTLLALRYDAGLPWDEVARVLGLRPSTAKLRFTEIRKLLSERWRR